MLIVVVDGMVAVLVGYHCDHHCCHDNPPRHRSLASVRLYDQATYYTIQHYHSWDEVVVAVEEEIESVSTKLWRLK